MTIPLTSADPARPYNQPYAVTPTITGTLAPYVAAMRAVHVRGWLREMTLQQVVEAWLAERGEVSRG